MAVYNVPWAPRKQQKLSENLTHFSLLVFLPFFAFGLVTSRIDSLCTPAELVLT